MILVNIFKVKFLIINTLSLNINKSFIYKNILCIFYLNIIFITINKYIYYYLYNNREAHASESDIEDGPDSTIVIPQKLNRNHRTEQRAVRLTEIGPRMTLQLTKIQNGFCDGSIIYHRFSMYFKYI